MTWLDTPAPPGTRNDLRPAAVVLFGLLVAAQVAVLVFSLWEPPFDGSVRYDDIAPIREAYWPMNVLLGGPGYAVGAVAGAVFLAVLGRGNPAALAGAALHLVGGVVFALVITAEVLPFAWAADPAVVGEAQGRALFEAYNSHLDAFVPYILGSMAVTALGALVAVAGAAAAGGLPWWAAGAALALVLLVFLPPLGTPVAIVAGVGQRLLWVYIGWRGLRAAAPRA